MDEPAPNTAPPAADPPPAADKAARLAAAAERLARQSAAQMEQEQRAPPPQSKPWLPLLQGLLWNLRLFFRWLRPKLIDALVVLLAVPIRAGLHLFRALKASNALPALASNLARIAAHLRGWWLWQWREIKLNPDRRLAVLGLLGGFILPLLTIIILAHIVPPPEDPVAAYVDTTVPAPETNFIEALPGEDRTVESASVADAPAALNRDNYSFELFARRENGELKLLSHVAEHYLEGWFPRGTPAVDFMRFFGSVMQRASGQSDLAMASRERCLSMPTTKVFTERTVTCTYSHPLPAPLAPNESPQSRVFWIIALSFDRASNLTDLRVHARLTFAPL
jgi:hypothetical protein